MAAGVNLHTPDELVDLLVTVIAGAVGGGKARWRNAIGTVEQLPTWSNVRSNWHINPIGTDKELTVIYEAAAIVRAEHPYIESQQDRLRRPPAATAPR